MRSALLVVLLLVSGSCAPPPAEQAEPAASNGSTQLPVAFIGVNVVPMDSEQVLNGQTVVIQGDRITAIGPAGEIEIPDGAVLVDGSGKYLMPGLAEMHGHIPPPNQPSEFTEAVLFMYVANGVTTVRGMLGAEGQLELRDRSNRGELIAPNLYLAGPSFRDSSINSPEEAVDKVRAQKAEGWDLLKIHPGLTIDEYDAIANTAREEGMRFGGHVPADVGLAHAIEMGQETFDHLDGYVEYLEGDKGPVDGTSLADIVERTRAAGALVVPTMALWGTLMGTNELETLTSFPELQYMPPQTVEQWTRQHESRLSADGFDAGVARQIIDSRMRILKALHEGGVPILMGTDAPQQFSVPGFSIHRELQVMAAAGMSPYEIIKSGTVNVGEYFKGHDDFGTVEVGKRADLLLVNANPLENIASVADRAGVMVRGAWLPEERIQERLAEIAASNN